MKFIGIIVLVLKIVEIENRMLPYHYGRISPREEYDHSRADTPSVEDSVDNENEKVIGLRTNSDEARENFPIDQKRTKKPCSIVVLSSFQNPTMQSLLRRYRYDSNGILIPSSVKYFIKLPQGLRESPLLVPLNDMAFSPLGGFVRYYKEVPPIPHSW